MTDLIDQTKDQKTDKTSEGIEDMTTTQERILRQLCENTGTDILDSGGSNGRMWQRNAGRDLFAEPDATYDDRWSGDGYLDVTISTAHYLDARLDVTRMSEALTRTFRNYVDADWQDGRRYGDLSQRYTNSIGTLEEWIDGDDRIDPHSEFSGSGNTYNEENILSQNFQWKMLEHDGIEYVAISTHNGADARGGYSDIVIYEMDGWDYFFDWNRATVGLECDYQRPQIEQDQIDLFTGESVGPVDECVFTVDIGQDYEVYNHRHFDWNGYHQFGLGDLTELAKDDHDGKLAYACPCGKGTLTVGSVDGPNCY